MNLDSKPYFRDYDVMSDYTEVLFKPQTVEQNREANEIQSIQKEYLKRISDVTLKDGTVVSGCEIIIQKNLTDNPSDHTLSITLTDGTIYASGLVRNFATQHVIIQGIGKEFVGVNVTPTIITSEQDESLLDPAEGQNAGLPGADRLKETLTLVANDANSIVLYNFQDGVLVNADTKLQDSVIGDLLADRTYDEVGNYKVRGMEILDLHEEDTVSNRIVLRVNEGKAYVKGYQITKNASTPIYLDRSVDYLNVVGEPKVFRNNTLKYALNYNPVNKITRVLAPILAIRTLTRGITSSDLLPLSPVIKIVKVVQGSTTYTEGVDYQLVSDSIDWSIGTNKPSVGTSYSVTWQYNTTLTSGVDYDLVTDSETNISYISFENKSGLVPVTNAQFTVDYSFFLDRIDVIVLDKNGNVSVIKGQPNVSSSVATPSYDGLSFLRLGFVYVEANSRNCYITNNAIERVTLEKMWSMFKRIEELEYNQAIQDLDQAAMEGESVSTLRGILTDSFMDFSKGDLYHSMFTAAYDLTEQCITTNSDENHYKLTTATTSGLVNFKGATTDETFISTKFTEEVLINQKYATEAISINPYNVYKNAATLKATPAASSVTGQVYDSSTSNVVTQRVVASRLYRNASWAEQERQRVLAAGGTVEYNKNDKLSSSSTTTLTTTTKERLITYIPQEKITVAGSGFNSFEDNIQVTFDNVTCSCTGTTSAHTGTKPGTLKANVDGYVSGYFTIPSGIRTGTREIMMKSDTSTIDGTSANASYVCPGVVIDTYNSVVKTTTIYQAYDPIAQSFSFDTDTFIGKCGLFFAKKHATAPVNVEIRDMVNGYPGTTRYALKTIPASAIAVSDTGTLETIIQFDDPVLCHANVQYCVVITCVSEETYVYCAKMGGTDLATKVKVTSQADAAGVMFTSSNALTWNAEQLKDLKYKLYARKYETSGQIIFDELTTNANMLYLSTDALLLAKCSCDWEYQINNSGAWYPILPLAEVYLSEVATKVQIRAKLTGTSKVSPILSKDILTLYTALNTLESTYVTKNVYLVDGVTSIKQSIELKLPMGTSGLLQFCTSGTGDTESSWVTGDLESSVPNTVTGYTTYTYKKNLSVAANNFRARIKLTSSKPYLVPRAKNLMNILK